MGAVLCVRAGSLQLQPWRQAAPWQVEQQMGWCAYGPVSVQLLAVEQLCCAAAGILCVSAVQLRSKRSGAAADW
jgi:hypothetical protein